MKTTTSGLPGANGATTSACVCSFRGRERDKYLHKVFPVTRLVAVNRDGSQQKKLLQNPFQPSGQINDRIIDWTPEEPRSVLIEKFNPQIGLRVLKLDIYSGETELYEKGRRVHRQLRYRWTRQGAAGLGKLSAQELLLRQARG